MQVEGPLPKEPKKNKTAGAGQASGAGAGVAKGSHEQGVARPWQTETFLAPVLSKEDVGSHQVLAAASGVVDKGDMQQIACSQPNGTIFGSGYVPVPIFGFL